LDESEIWEDEDDTGFDVEEVAEPEEAPVAPPPVKETKPEPVKEVPVVEAKKEPAPVETVKIEKPAETKRVERPAEVKTETATEEPLTINQIMAAQLNKSGKASAQPHAQPVTDLKQAITLNDKLLYIKDLFNGYNLAYSEAIDILNRFSSFEEAQDFLQNNYATKNRWDTRQATVDKFYELLRRRYF
jgi:hypothetical protein